MNYQNIPRDLYVVKRAFVPKQGAFSFFDYSQIEPRTFAFFVYRALGDDTIVQWYRDGRDVYRELAGLVYAKEPDEITADERQMAKVWFLMSLYGAGPKKVSQEIGMPYSEARQFYLDFHARLPQIKALSNPRPKKPGIPWEPGVIERVYQRRGYIKTPWGRHLHAEQYGEHKLLNKLIQGTAAEVMKEAVVLVDEWLLREGLQTHLVSVIHDELITDGPEEELPILHEHVPELMREATRAPNGDFIHEVVPIDVDHEVSTTTWADKIAYEEWFARTNPQGARYAARA